MIGIGIKNKCVGAGFRGFFTVNSFYLRLKFCEGKTCTCIGEKEPLLSQIDFICYVGIKKREN